MEAPLTRKFDCEEHNPTGGFSIKPQEQAAYHDIHIPFTNIE